MGKGDKKSKRGKTTMGSYGKTRSRAKLTKKRGNATKANSRASAKSTSTKDTAKKAAKKAVKKAE